MRCPEATRFGMLVTGAPEAPELRVLAKKPRERWTSADCVNAQRTIGRIEKLRAQGCDAGTVEALRRLGAAAHCGLGRTTYAQKRAHERSRLITVPEAQARIASKGPVPTSLPSHIRPFANWMVSRAGKPPTSREIIKAYVIATSSVMRGGLPKPTVCEAYPEYQEIKRLANRKNLRPEDTMATLLFTPAGKRYLDAAERGRLDAASVKWLVERMTCFGFPNVLTEQLEYAPALAHKRDAIRAAFKGSRAEWITYVKKNVSGVSAAKAGFFAALLGRGDMPTYDAREIALWRRKPPKVDGKSPGGPEVEAYAERIAAYPLTLDPQYEPFRAHLVHHALWEAYPVRGKRSKTTHGATIRAMQFAGLGGLNKATRAERAAERAEIVRLAEAAAEEFVSDGWTTEDLASLRNRVPTWISRDKNATALYLRTAEEWVREAREGLDK